MSPLSFQPWPLEKPQTPNIIDVLARVQVERGQLFRNITEATLEEEIAADGGLSPEESTSEDEEGDNERSKQTNNGQPVSREELQRAKFDMMQQVGIAHNEIMMALDFISLLESEHAPQGQNSMSQALKDSVPSKTLGTDIWARMPVDEAKQAQDRVLARNVKMRSLQRSADDILGAAKRLEDNVRKETQFWEQMLSISGQGWSICRIPGTKRLGVRYGFSESATEFSKRNVAALNGNDDGSISLERGFGTRPTGLRVTVVRDGQAAGKSYLPSTTDDSETTLEGRIRHARDSIFDEELFRETTRESRTMTSIGVSMRGRTIRLPTAATDEADSAEILMELVPLDDEPEMQNNPSNSDDAIAQAIALGARLILSQAHRDSLKKRSEVPQLMAERSEERPVKSILKPLTSFLLHKASLEAVNSFFEKAASVLSEAGIEVSVSRAAFSLPENSQVTNTEELVAILKSEFVSAARFGIKAAGHEHEIVIVVRGSTAETQNISSKLSLTVSNGETTTPRQQIEDLVQSTEAAITSVLASALRSNLDVSWRYDERQSLFTREEDGQNERQQVQISFDSQRRLLALRSLRKELVWEQGRDLPGTGIVDGWLEVAGQLGVRERKS